MQLGLILAGVTGAVLWFWLPGMMRTIAGEPATSFIGTAAQAWGLALALGALVLTGVALAGTGLTMIGGRASRAPTIAAIGFLLAAVILIATVLVDAYAP